MASLLELKQLQMGGELYLCTQGQMSQPLSITLKVLQSSFDCINSLEVCSYSLYNSFKIQVQKNEKREFMW